MLRTAGRQLRVLLSLSVWWVGCFSARRWSDGGASGADGISLVPVVVSLLSPAVLGRLSISRPVRWWCCWWCQ